MGWFGKLDQMLGGYLPGGPSPKEVTWRDALGQWGDAAKTFAPAAAFLPGPGWVLGGLAGAGGGALGTLDNDGMGAGEGGTGWGSALKSAVGGGVMGAAGGYGVDKLQAGIAAANAGGGAAAAGGSSLPAPQVAMANSTGAGSLYSAPAIGGATGMAPTMAGAASVARVAPPQVPGIGATMRDLWNGGKKVAGGVVNAAKEDPLQAAAIGLEGVGNIMGGRAETQALNQRNELDERMVALREREYEEEQERRRRMGQLLKPILSEIYERNRTEV